MAVKIRLTRMGDKQAPFYRVIVADSRSPRDGKFIDLIGTYNPLSASSEYKLDAEKAKEWLAKGAQPTDTVRSIFVSQGIITQTKRPPAKTGPKKEKKD